MRPGIRHSEVWSGQPRRPESLLAQNFPDSVFLPPERAALLIDALGKAGISGGSVYDALVGATAVGHGLKLATRDKRALVTYRALQVDLEILAD